ncbi:MAG: hypothetical protein IRZ18_04125 [Clostridia bacterium]|nr:hypothetical protein [Clostridia bacterium]
MQTFNKNGEPVITISVGCTEPITSASIQWPSSYDVEEVEPLMQAEHTPTVLVRSYVIHGCLGNATEQAKLQVTVITKSGREHAWSMETPF